MASPRFALWLLARTNCSGYREALIGDLLEEIARGRSRLWAWQQLVGLGAFVVVAHARNRLRVTPHLIALLLGVVLLGGMSIASPSTVLEAWIGFYLVAGTLSLFAHIMARAADSRTLQL